jgi:wobble nucleotide-excising tRNase
MKIKTIHKVKDYQIFRDFSWPASLSEFKDFNLIYGWNGSGKTILSNIFGDLQRNHLSVTGSEFHIETENGTIKGQTLGTAPNLPSVRVFNKEFVMQNVFTSAGDVAPIFVLGEDSVEKQKQIDKLKGQLQGRQKQADTKHAEVQDAEINLDQLNIHKALAIKQLLSSSGQNPYNNYDKAAFKGKCNELKNQSWQTFILNAAAKNTFRKQKEESPQNTVELVDFSFADIPSLVPRVKHTLSKTVVSVVIERLKHDSEVSNWVAEGLQLHRKKSSPACLFCEKPLDGQLAKLEEHFNDEYNQLLSEIEELKEQIESLTDLAKNLALPNKAQLYDHLQVEYESKCDIFEQEKQDYIGTLRLLSQKLAGKKKDVFKAIRLDGKVVAPIEMTIDELNDVIKKHNEKSANFANEVRNARVNLENSCVAEVLDEVLEKENRIESLKKEGQGIKHDVTRIKTNISDLERDIVEHCRPADELNGDLAAYLGRSELQFETKENGYQIIRNGVTAEGLSEGEKTAIAFLYFLKSLEDKNFDIQNGIVVIDDPVSSLDANSLFSAFGFMKERTRNVGQLFIFTHNFCFFRQVKNWFDYINKYKNRLHREANFYMLQCEGVRESRTAKITILDKLLMDYESEYHYLFSLVHKGANSTSVELEAFYHLPNITRRLLEAFLAFRKPSKETLYAKLEQLNFDTAKKARIYRFLQAHAHGDDIDDPKHDISILSETPAVLTDILTLIKSEDKGHFEEMEKAITTT